MHKCSTACRKTPPGNRDIQAAQDDLKQKAGMAMKPLPAFKFHPITCRCVTLGNAPNLSEPLFYCHIWKRRSSPPSQGCHDQVNEYVSGASNNICGVTIALRFLAIITL